MPRSKTNRTYNEQIQTIVQRYQRDGERWPATARNIAAWAIRKGLWEPRKSAVVDQCADHISRAMREEYITDPQGRRVRAKHAARLKQGEEQLTLWGDIRTASREHMDVAFKQRREQVVGDCRQLKTDVDSYNENVNEADPIQMIFDFTLDLEELEAVA